MPVGRPSLSMPSPLSSLVVAAAWTGGRRGVIPVALSSSLAPALQRNDLGDASILQLGDRGEHRAGDMQRGGARHDHATIGDDADIVAGDLDARRVFKPIIHDPLSFVRVPSLDRLIGEAAIGQTRSPRFQGVSA